MAVVEACRGAGRREVPAVRPPGPVGVGEWPAPSARASPGLSPVETTPRSSVRGLCAFVRTRGGCAGFRGEQPQTAARGPGLPFLLPVRLPYLLRFLWTRCCHSSCLTRCRTTCLRRLRPGGTSRPRGAGPTGGTLRVPASNLRASDAADVAAVRVDAVVSHVRAGPAPRGGPATASPVCRGRRFRPGAGSAHRRARVRRARSRRREPRTAARWRSAVRRAGDQAGGRTFRPRVRRGRGVRGLRGARTGGGRSGPRGRRPRAARGARGRRGGRSGGASPSRAGRRRLGVRGGCRRGGGGPWRTRRCPAGGRGRSPFSRR